ncbi:hypothetical protein ACER0C_001229 [Sarotherodon galilaeus]
MELLQMLLPALFFMSVFSEGSIPYVKVMLGDSFILPGNCESEEDGKLRQIQPQSRDVDAHRHRVWRTEESFRDRISPNSSVVFKRSVYTDSGGYGFMCGGREVSAVQVEVVVFSETSITEGEVCSLPCYYLQLAPADVLKRDSCDGNSNWTANDQRSLTRRPVLKPAVGSEGRSGDYFCYIQKEVRRELRGTPAAARLKVSERSPDQTTSTPPSPSVSESCEEKGLGTPAVVCITAGVCLAVILVGWLLKSYWSRCASCPLRWTHLSCRIRGLDRLPGLHPEVIKPLNSPTSQQISGSYYQFTV